MIRISACVIVKNEEKNMESWLAGIGEIADEKIVVDTGSTDRTMEIARAAGAEVYSYLWKDDFAAAKNFALDQAAGQWILFLDADEYFDRATQQRLRTYLEQIHGNQRIAGLVSPWYNIDKDQNNKLISQDYQMRIFRHEKFLRYEGVIHEQVVNTDLKKRIFKMSDFLIYHTGYSASIVRAKTERNLRIMLDDIEKNGREERYYSPLMDCYYAQKDYDKAAKYARLALSASYQLVGQKVRQYTCLFDSLNLSGHPEEELQEVLAQAIQNCPEYPEPFCQKAYLAYEHGRYLEAEQCLKKAVYLNQQPAAHPEECMDSDMAVSLPYVHWLLGKIQEKKGILEKAAEYYCEALRLNRYQEEALRSLYAIVQEEDAASVLELLGEFYERARDRDFLVRVLQQYRYGMVYLYIAEPEPDSYEAFMSAAQYSAAARCAAEELAALQQAAASIIPQGTIEQQSIWQQLRPAGMPQGEKAG